MTYKQFPQNLFVNMSPFNSWRFPIGLFYTFHISIDQKWTIIVNLPDDNFYQQATIIG